MLQETEALDGTMGGSVNEGGTPTASVTAPTTKSTTRRSWAVPAPIAAGRVVPQHREVYFIQGEKTKLIKIGVSDNARARLTHMQAHSPDKLVLLGVIVCERRGVTEKELHERFAKSRLHGEWFKPSRRLRVLIESRATWPEPQKRMKARAKFNEWDEVLSPSVSGDGK